jgi:CRP/FNR family cyclic AMP-dependent transcriptional regulator
MTVPLELLRRVDLFDEMRDRDLERLAKSFRESRFDTGEVIAAEGRSGVGFFVIGEGIVTYSIGGTNVGTGGPGDYFGEVALIDDGPRTATVTADTPVTAWGLTSWEFRPLVEENAEIAWELLRKMAQRLRVANESAGQAR